MMTRHLVFSAALLALCSVAIADKPDFSLLESMPDVPAIGVKPNFGLLESMRHEACDFSHIETARPGKKCSEDCTCEDCGCKDCKCTLGIKPLITAEEPLQPSTRRVYILMFTADYCKKPCGDAKASISKTLVPAGWKMGDDPDANIREIKVDEHQEIATVLSIESLPTFIVMLDGREQYRSEGYPGWKELADQYNKAAKMTHASQKQDAPADAATTPRKSAGYYPLGNSAFVSQNVGGRLHGWSLEAIRGHLKTGGAHGHDFDHAWVDTLNLQQAVALHNDDHAGRVQWQYVYKPGTFNKEQTTSVAAKPPKAKPATTKTQAATSGRCKDGRCGLRFGG